MRLRRMKVNTLNAVPNAVIAAALLLMALSAAAYFQTLTKPMVSGDGHGIGRVVVDSALSLINRHYVFPEVALEVVDEVGLRARSGAYDTLSSPIALAERLTIDVQEVSRDRHLAIIYAPALAGTSGGSPTDFGYCYSHYSARRENFGFVKVEHLRGNIGYLKLDEFQDTALAKSTALAAMSFLANSDAVIFDLRDNEGGSLTMLQLLMGYLFDKPVHLNDLTIRDSSGIQQLWSIPHSDGASLAHADVYVLTSGRTFSAAEMFAYDLKCMKRAVIVGERTAGASHPSATYALGGLSFVATVPVARATSPITGEDWEGVGVHPDVAVTGDKAVATAYSEALRRLAGAAADDFRRQELRWILVQADAERNPVAVDSSVLKKCVGVYGERTVTYEDGALFSQRRGQPKYRLLPISNDLFGFDGTDDIRLKFVPDGDGRIHELVTMMSDGRQETARRINPNFLP